jgi:nucleoside-triphosphatase
MASVYLLTGSPGTGKTTVIQQAISGQGIKSGGFYTEEIRAAGVRQGFRIITLDGHDAVLSHIGTSSRYRVSKYGVDISNLENIGAAAIERAVADSDLIVIDEIGKMELLSPRFREAVLEAIDSDKKVLGTIMLNPHPFADQIKRRHGVKVVELTRTNHQQVLEEITDWLKGDC